MAVKVSKIDITTIYIHLCEMSWKYFEIHLAVPCHGTVCPLTEQFLIFPTCEKLAAGGKTASVASRRDGLNLLQNRVYCSISFN